MSDRIEIDVGGLFGEGSAAEHEESALCRLAEASLRLAYRGAEPSISPAPDRGPGAFGVLDVRLTWRSGEAPILVRVVVHDEHARGAWREASMLIGDAVRRALRQRCPAHNERKPHE